MKNLAKHLDNTVVRVVLLVLFFIGLLVLINCYCQNQKKAVKTTENFVDY